MVFSREASAAAFIESMIRKAEGPVEAALHQLNNPRLIRALLDVAQRGVHVRLLLDRAKYEEGPPSSPTCLDGHVAVRLLTGRRGLGSRMHHKFAVLGRHAAVTGSYNWTVGSDEENFENLVILHGRTEVKAYRREFRALWQQGVDAAHFLRASPALSGEGNGGAATASSEATNGALAAERGYRVCLMRHGDAVPPDSSNSLDDSQCPLAPDGKKKVGEIACGLQAIGFDADWVVSSPWRRAVETAMLVAALLPSDVPMECCEALLPGGSAAGWIRFLRKRPERRCVLAVGHEPGLSRLAARLLGGSEDANLRLKKGGCCLLEFVDPPRDAGGRLVWWLPPRILRKLR